MRMFPYGFELELSITIKISLGIMCILKLSIYPYLATVVWKYFVVEKFSWAMISTKTFTQNILNTNNIN